DICRRARGHERFLARDKRLHGVLARSKALVPDETPGMAGERVARSHIVEDPEPEGDFAIIHMVIQPRAPQVNIRNGSGVGANEVVGKQPWTVRYTWREGAAVPDVHAQ